MTTSKAKTMDHWLLLGIGFIFLISFHNSFKPLWIDEVLNFSGGAYDTFDAAWTDFIQSLRSHLNVGQTGAYFLWCFLVFKIIPASTIALRLPSLFSMLFLLVACNQLWNRFEIDLIKKLLGFFLIYFSFEIVQHFGDARPYAPLAAASIGILAYFLNRNLWIGIISIILGSLFHPYFILYYFAAMIIGGVVNRKIEIAPFLSIFFFSLFLLVAKVSWLSFLDHPMRMDPFQYIEKGRFLKTFLSSHFNFISQFGKLKFLLLPLLFGNAFLNRKEAKFQITAPLLIVSAALSISLLISARSYISGYWILQRQWIGSVIWVTSAIPLLIPNGFTFRNTIVKKLISIAASIYITSLVVSNLSYQYQLRSKWLGKKAQFLEHPPSFNTSENDNISELATYNCMLGEKVLKELQYSQWESEK